MGNGQREGSHRNRKLAGHEGSKVHAATPIARHTHTRPARLAWGRNQRHPRPSFPHSGSARQLRVGGFVDAREHQAVFPTSSHRAVTTSADMQYVTPACRPAAEPFSGAPGLVCSPKASREARLVALRRSAFTQSRRPAANALRAACRHGQPKSKRT